MRFSERVRFSLEGRMSDGYTENSSVIVILISGKTIRASIAVLNIRHTHDIDINKQMRIRLLGMIKVAVNMNNNFCLRPVKSICFTKANQSNHLDIVLKLNQAKKYLILRLMFSDQILVKLF